MPKKWGKLKPMASNAEFVEFVVDQMAAAGHISSRKMFGEYGVYCDGKLIGLVCDDQLFIKPTEAGREFIGKTVEAPPYPSAKPSLLISTTQLEDADWLAELVRLTFAALPMPKKKNSRRKA